MGILSRLGRAMVALGTPEPTRRAARAPLLRNFNAATPDRTNQTWSTLNESSNRELRYALRNLRARSRDLANNNEYAAKFVDMCAQNIVGPDGLVMEPCGTTARGKQDDATNEQIEEAWEAWGRRGVCTIDGMLSWVDAQRVICEGVARDGEILVKHIVGPTAKNEFGYAIQIMESDYLDELYYLNNDPSGAGIFMGVETDASSRVTAYYILSYNPADYGYSGAAGRTRIAVEDMEHIYVPRRGHQRRGVPWMTASMSSLFQLGEFKESELVATRVSAAKMGFYTQGLEGSAPMGSDDNDGNDEPLQDVEPGTFEKLPYGWDMKVVDWHHPNIQFDAFVKSCLRGSAAGMGVGYNTLASDLENVNYSSLREGRLETTDLWRNRQRWFAEWVCQPVYSRWLDMAVLAGKVNVPQAKADSARYPKWQGRGWAWVDPEKEANSNRIALALGLRTRTDVLAEQGKDFNDVIERLADEAAAMIALGLNPDIPLPGKSSSPGIEAEDTPGNPDAEPQQQPITPGGDTGAPQVAAPAPAPKAAAAPAKTTASAPKRDEVLELVRALETKFDSRIDKILSAVTRASKE